MANAISNKVQVSTVRTLRSRTTVKIEFPPENSNAEGKVNILMQNSKIKGKKGVKTEKKLCLKNELLDTNKDSLETASKCKLEIPGVPQKSSISPRKRRQPKMEENKISKIKKEIKVENSENQVLADIEDSAWEPSNWKLVLDNILKMRKMYVAPVDSLGCEECPEEGATPEVFRYQTLISVMLSSQTRDQVTYAATQRLIEHGLNVDNILKTPDEKIGELIYPAGFWKSKIKYIKQTTQILKDKYDGDIPRTLKELCGLPGVGPKMANIVMSVAWNDTVGIAVDTHVHRISNRLGWVKKPTKDPEQTRKALESWLPKELWKDVSLHLVGLGQTVCKPIKPNCQDCLNVHLCPTGRSSKK
ncbi:endonuclease III-like protein 1 isoform X2 [Stegodyphus dumicola]|uniref:endonuclease III-like protein 1 isoform X2 n=1 Tax=Stegodyphus dumicola TaxID=202533 RepID=UPI0015B0AC7C|nr:endonuclease III-like protein 1 isoform X2 [Stegodyphus dumicola]